MMNRYTLMFANGDHITFENDQSIDEILAILNGTRDTFINIGEAAIVQKSDITAIVDESMSEREYGYEF